MPLKFNFIFIVSQEIENIIYAFVTLKQNNGINLRMK